MTWVVEPCLGNCFPTFRMNVPPSVNRVITLRMKAARSESGNPVTQNNGILSCENWIVCYTRTDEHDAHHRRIFAALVVFKSVKYKQQADATLLDVITPTTRGDAGSIQTYKQPSARVHTTAALWRRTNICLSICLSVCLFSVRKTYTCQRPYTHPS